MTFQSSMPIFIVGSPRSGTSVLTWAIGQHPNILPLEETDWIWRLTLDLGGAYELGTRRGERSQLSSMGVTIEDFFATFGQAIDALILNHKDRFEKLCRQRALSTPGQQSADFLISRSSEDPKNRWIDGTPENSFHIAALFKLFPLARFIHVVRDVQAVVRSMLNFANVSGFAIAETEEAAYQYWLRAVTACREAERGFGSERVLRIRHGDMIARPESIVRQCLEFLGENYCSDCLAPLASTINSSRVAPDFIVDDVNTSVALKEEVLALSRELMEEDRPRYLPDPEIALQIEQKFVENCRKFSLRKAKKLTSQTTPLGSSSTPIELDRAVLLERIRAAVHRLAPYDATVIVVSKGDPELLNLYGRRAWHFPRTERGDYSGYYPAGSIAATGHLEELRARGGQFLLFPRPSFWWLDFYHDFHRHLNERYQCTWQDEACILYHLCEASGGES
jgi:hypothetical protein